MTKLTTRVRVLCTVVVALCVPALAQPAPLDGPGLADRIPNFESRLEALAPAHPRAYFELGEEVAAEAATPADRQLARQLFALSFELNRRRLKPGEANPDPQLPSSACLALASVASSSNDRRWLTSLAAVVAPAGAETAPVDTTNGDRAARPGALSLTNPIALDAANVLGLIRAGEGRRAARVLAQAGVTELLQQDQALLASVPAGWNPSATTSLNELHRLIDRWPVCPRCHNRRSVKDAHGVHLCPVCQGTPGPSFSDEELAIQLRTESALLQGVQHSWAAQTLVDSGAPLRELDPADVVVALGIDADRCLWRNGTWATESRAENVKSSQASPEAQPKLAPTSSGSNQ